MRKDPKTVFFNLIEKRRINRTHDESGALRAPVFVCQ
jgi:hypothetical protein